MLLEYSRGECIKVIGEMWEVPREVYAIYIRKKFATGRRVIEDAALERVFELANDITGDVQQLCAQSEIWVWIVAEPPIHDRDGRAPFQLYRIDDLCFITSYNRKLDILLNGIASALLDDYGLPC